MFYVNETMAMRSQVAEVQSYLSQGNNSLIISVMQNVNTCRNY